MTKSIEEIDREMADTVNTRCLYVDLHTCAAQHCGNFVDNPFESPPFCASCIALLPEIGVIRLIAEWSRPIMIQIEEDELRSIVGRRGTRLDYFTGRKKARMVHDFAGRTEHLRRLEIQTAWTLRGIKRRSATR